MLLSRVHVRRSRCPYSIGRLRRSIGVVNPLEKMSIWLAAAGPCRIALESSTAGYDRAVSRCARYGLERVVNGTDRILISPKARDILEEL
jgi:hypothetical protein